MLLAIDIGNTNVTMGLYKDSQSLQHWRLATDHDRMPDEYGFQILGLLEHVDCSPEKIVGVCLASVVPQLTSRIQQACIQYIKQEPLMIDHHLKTGIQIRYDDPAAIGADRIADAAAVYHLYKGPACIVDFGTATTFNAITINGEYLGGAIAPGIGIATEALFNRTAQLPRIEMKSPPSVIGRNTIHAIQSGIMYGYVGLVEGMVSRFQKVLGEDMKVIATGGLAELIANETKSIQIIAPWLTLDGIQILWMLNRS